MKTSLKSRIKIVSGGQTGVDQAALDAALDQGVPAGGWCPKGRRAENGVMPDKYPLTEMSSGSYRARTRQNVVDSDGTVIIYFNGISGGTKLTHTYCIDKGKPYLLIDGILISETETAEQVEAFIEEHDIKVLNVAGPRASKEERAYPYTYSVVSRILWSN